MAGASSPRRRRATEHRFLTALSDRQVRVALITAIALLVQAVVAKNVLDVELDFVSQTAALWVFIVFQISGGRDRFAELSFVAAIIAVTAAVLTLYAFS